MYQAIGIIELKSIAQGVEATDAALKSAGVQLISAHAACPGKFEIILTGAIADVTAAVEHVTGRFDQKLIDSSIMGRIDPAVVAAMFGTQAAPKTGSLGVIETFSAASAIRQRILQSKQQRWKSLSCAPPAVWAVRASC